MNLNQVTASIGRAFAQEQEILDPLLKQPKKLKSDEAGFVVKLVFDMSKDRINFRLFTRLTENSSKEYRYFGNNSAAGFQYYIVRESTGLHYILTSAFSDLYQILLKHKNQEKTIGNLLKQLSDKGLITLANKKGQGQINLNKLFIEGQKEIKLDHAKKKIILGDNEYSYEGFIRYLINEENRKNKMVLVVPTIIDESGNEVVLSQHSDYEEIVVKENNLGDDGEEKEQKVNGIERICHLCGSKRKDVLSSYSAKFSRSGINKVFTTTTINTSSFNKKYSCDDSYGICKTCYKHLLAGEKIISSKFNSRIANENVFIIPEGLTTDFNYERVQEIHKDIDMAFHPQKALKWLKGLDYAYRQKVKGYSANMVFYRSDGTSLSILQTIEEIPVIRLVNVADVIDENREKLEGHVHHFTLGNIYSLVPVRTNKSGDQLDIKRVISLYDAILSGYMIDAKTIFKYFTEALDKGTKQLEKARIDNYNNMGLDYYKNKFNESSVDFFIRNISIGYLLLLQSIQELGLVSKTIFTGEVKGTMDKLITASEKINTAIEEVEAFLDRQQFSREAKALFYLGTLINRVALAQYHKGHKKKPILKKIQFQGMNMREVLRLYYDVIEKLIQYERLDLYAEALDNRFHLYYDGAMNDYWSLDEHANVFYIMSGYSYLAGKWEGSKDELNSEDTDIDNEEGEEE
ncbi:CRISPR-associated protein TM1802 [Clostridium aceticum]|uniref:CRISPR-associated protein TM1802 n=1 Tax=Clostridium aceticum TaxID=84022 RepID=A0A0D8IGB0_9CLOT|nr:TM1802 family CRISPR-associated protein [Clostridium aceticum]AKL94552.1 CRISPR-associated protein TM1802 [Clostridium aceticum]KJF28246.1 hypothetical protein TZ02_02370 [Clostridium aceticum]